MKSGWSRRQFLKTTTAAVVLGTAERATAAASSSLPKRRLGKTGEMSRASVLAPAPVSARSKTKRRRKRYSNGLSLSESTISTPPAPTRVEA